MEIPYKLKEIARLYKTLRPGDEIRVSAIRLDEASINYVLDGTIGSAFEYGFIAPFTTRDDAWILFRLKSPLIDSTSRTYVSPDRRHLYTKDFHGIYRRN